MVLRDRVMLFPFLFFLICTLSGCGLEPGSSEERVLPLSVDLVVVGDGIGGLTASLEASRRGAAVVVFCGKTLDEHWMWEEGAICPDDTGPDLFKEMLAACGRGKDWHYELLSRNVAGALDWLSRETGLKTSPEEPYRYVPDNLSYEQVHRRLKEKALLEGVRFIEGKVPENLLFNAAGETAGISFGDPAGALKQVYAPVIILADGGYLNDPEQVEQLAPGTATASWKSSGYGTGIRLARAAGLDLVDESLFSYTLAVEQEQGWMAVEPPPGTLLIVERQVTAISKENESDLANLLARGPFRSGHLLLPGAGLDPEDEPDWPRYSGITAFMESCRLNVPELGRRFSHPEAIFFGCRVKPAAAYCLGGIAVNESGRVLRNGQPVQGLYALGETAGGLNGKAVVPGTALAEALVWGRHLGQAAVR